MNILSQCIIIISAIFSMGCATVFSGRTQAISIVSTPDQAKVTIDGKDIGTTPCNVAAPREKSILLVIKKEGYADYILPLSGNLSATFWITNGLNCTIIGSGTSGTTTDLNTGSAYEYSPGSYHVDLIPKNYTAPNNQVNIMGDASTNGGKIKRFIVVNYESIGRELSSSPADKVDALREIMGYGQKPISDFSQMIKNDYFSSKDANEFSEKMLLINR